MWEGQPNSSCLSSSALTLRKRFSTLSHLRRVQFPFCKRGSWSSERLRYFSRITQLLNDRTWSKNPDSGFLVCFHYNLEKMSNKRVACWPPVLSEIKGWQVGGKGCLRNEKEDCSQGAMLALCTHNPLQLSHQIYT